jgi:hypothetical protein
MTATAVKLSGVDACWRIPSNDIFSPRDDVEVVRVDASWCLTQVVGLQSAGWFSVDQAQRKVHGSSRMPVVPKLAVSLNVEIARPQPAPVALWTDEANKSHDISANEDEALAAGPGVPDESSQRGNQERVR